jgi:hypothetical protein
VRSHERESPRLGGLATNATVCSTMAMGELLQSDLAVRAKFVGANDRLPTDERAEIDTREVLGALWTQRRVRDLASRTHDGTEPVVARQSPNLGTAEWWTSPASAPEADPADRP